MKVFKISESMKVASIWVVWAFLSIGALGWALCVVVAAVGVKDAADWVQALGTILALIGAAYFPLWHSGRAERRQREAYIELVATLGHKAFDLVDLLNKVFLDPDSWYRLVENFHRAGIESEFEPLLIALNQIPLDRVPAQNALHLIAARDAVHYAIQLSKHLPEWKNRREPNFEMVRSLEDKLDMLAGCLKNLPLPHHKR